MTTKANYALGLTGLIDYGTNYPLLDLMKQAREFDWSGKAYAEMAKDANGWPTETWATLWANLDPGTYVFTWADTGTILVTGVGGQVITDHRIEIVVSTPTNIGFLVTANSASPNNVKNVKFFQKRFETRLTNGERFNPDWLKVITNAKQLRCKDFSRADSSTISAWANRNTLTSIPFWTTNDGMPVEVMVELANLLDADIWFALPYRASTDYATQFATYVKNNLDTALVATFENGNEPWNFAFVDQYNWLKGLVVSIWGTTADSDEWIQYAAKLATLNAIAVNTVFSGQTSRIRHAINVQTAGLGLANTQLAAALWASKEPGSYVDPRTIFHNRAVTTYFGNAICGDLTRATDILNYLSANGQAATFDYLNAIILGSSFAQSIPNVKLQWQGQLSAAAASSMGLVAYEGGQHVEDAIYADGLSGGQIATLLALMQAWVRSKQMSDLYATSFDEWAAVVPLALYMQYVDLLKPAGGSSSWGMRSNFTDFVPREAALQSRGRGLPYREGYVGVSALAS